MSYYKNDKKLYKNLIYLSDKVINGINFTLIV